MLAYSDSVCVPTTTCAFKAQLSSILLYGYGKGLNHKCSQPETSGCTPVCSNLASSRSYLNIDLVAPHT